MKSISLVIIALFCSIIINAQTKGSISGWIVNKNTQTPIAGVTVKVLNTSFSTVSDSLGRYQLTNIPTGQYQVIFTSLGSIPYTLYNVVVSSGNETINTIELLPQEVTLKEVLVGGNRKTVRAATLETPLSVQKLTAEEIKSSPGSNFDISKVVQTLPGVTGSASTSAGFRNDIIVRGGAPNENVFYLDGIEIPVINHFSTQGSAGGPQGILNVSFIDEVKLSTSAFDAKFDNALSSVFEFKQKRGNTDKTQGNIRLSATEMAATLEGPLSASGKTTYLLSARRSYLQFLFEALDLPIRPNYWDFQYKVTHQIDPKTTITLLGLGAIDDFYFAAPKKATPEKIYALNAGPSINQWNYTFGASLKKLINKGFWNLSISRNQLNNINERYQNNLGPDKGEKTLDYTSNESGNHLRWDLTKTVAGWKCTTGVNIESINYSNNTYQLLRYNSLTNLGGVNTLTNPLSIQYQNQIVFTKYGGFVQIGKKAFNNRLGISGGIRMDGNSFTKDGNAIEKRISPRMSLSYVLNLSLIHI